VGSALFIPAQQFTIGIGQLERIPVYALFLEAGNDLP
jgi:hypothetical protein